MKKKELKHSIIGLNAFPCTEGFILTSEEEGLLGASLSHPVTCNLVN